MEISNNNSFPQKPSDVKKISNSSSKHTTERTDNTISRSQSTDDILISQQNDLSIIQIQINGLESIKNSLEEAPKQTKEQIDIILDKSQYHNQKVLTPYADTLKKTPEAELPRKVDQLLTQLKSDRQEILWEIDKTETTVQNKLSLESWNTQKNPEELLHQVISSLENQDNLFNHISPERITDLLSD